MNRRTERSSGKAMNQAEREREKTMNQAERRRFLIEELEKEEPAYQELQVPSGADQQRALLRGLLNIRAPKRMGAEFQKVQDAYLQGEIAAKGITKQAICIDEDIGEILAKMV